jgi:hypothetical protein
LLRLPLQPFEQIVVSLFNGVVKAEVTSAINSQLTDVLDNQVRVFALLPQSVQSLRTVALAAVYLQGMTNTIV